MASLANVQPITIEQYLAFVSPAGYHDELINGRIVVSPEPLHHDISQNIYRLLSDAVGPSYQVGQRMNLRFPAVHSMPSPDVFVIAHAAWQEARQANEYPAGARCLLVVEVVSPGHRAKSVREKIALYESNGIEAWVVYPKRQEVVVRGRSYTLKGDSLIELPGELAGASVSVAEIFRFR